MSKIEWTDKTWNPVTGCTKISEGCRHCYAETIAIRFWKGRKFADVQCHPERLEQPLKWRKPAMVFVNSMSDLFHEDIPDEFIKKVWTIMAKAHRHTFQVLTKRPDRMYDFVTNVLFRPGTFRDGATIAWPSNIWLGVSVENQEQANKRIPKLLETPAGVRFLSCEPLLDQVDFSPWTGLSGWTGGSIDWVICGGESGPKARNMEIQWAALIRDICKQAEIPFFMKQMAKKAPIPESLLIREYPER